VTAVELLTLAGVLFALANVAWLLALPLVALWKRVKERKR
jgi:hypothetical protein